MLSVIIPVYNVGKYLTECLDSIVNQSYKDLEIIIVNDGSTDNSKECIEKFLNDDRVKYLEQKNAGVSMARNLAMEQASGEYISFIDPDDILDLTMFEKLMDKIESTKADAVICGYQRFYDDGSKPVESVLFNVEEDKTYNSKEIIDKLLNSEIKGFLWNKIFKAEKIKESNFYFAEGRFVQDYYPVFKQLVESSKVAFVNEELYHYRLRSSSITFKKDNKLFNDYVFAVESIFGYLKDKEFKQQSYENFKVTVTYEALKRFIDAKLKLSRKSYAEFKSLTAKYMDISLKEIIAAETISFKQKVFLVLWKSRLYHIIAKFRK